MSSRKDPQPADPKPDKSGSAGTESVSASAWKTNAKAVRRAFPGPPGASALLRVAMDRTAHAELIAHAKESLDKEICGVLAGAICEDGQGEFVYVNAVIRGAAASHGSTHVTFTQDTWNQIHQTLDRDYPKLQIVGWYHSHPGFGVEFSEMDLFIQRNFFSGPTQIALVTDPLSGAVAICLNTEQGIRYLERYWIDGREQLCQAPRRSSPSSAPDKTAAGDAASDANLQSLEARLSQLLQAVDEQRASQYRFLLFLGILVCAAVVFGIGYTIYSTYRYRNEPPQVTQYAPVPVQVGDKTVLLGVAVVQWKVPDELNALLLAAQEKQLAAEKAAQTNQANRAAADTNAAVKP